MPINPFLKQNKKEEKPIKIYVSENFVDEKGNPVPFILKIISSEEAEIVSDLCLDPVLDPATHRKIGEEVNQKRLQMELIARSIVEPDLTDKETQDSWGANSPADLLNKMLNFKEKATLFSEFDKYFKPNEQKSEDAEKETKND